MGDRLADRTAIVTGSSRGIGAGIARRFAAEGANVVVTSRSLDRAEEAVDQLDANGGTVLANQVNVTDEGAVETLVEETTDRFGQLDILVNNAGAIAIAPPMSLAEDEWRRLYEVNVLGTLFGSRAAFRHMERNEESAQIINISSIWSEVGVPGRAAYAASKAAVNNLTRSLAVEFAEEAVMVNAIAPGMIDAGMAASLKDGPSASESDPSLRFDFEYEALLDRIPLGRFGDVEEIANTALFLAEGRHYLTGEILHCDGGWLAFGWGSKTA